MLRKSGFVTYRYLVTNRPKKPSLDELIKLEELSASGVPILIPRHAITGPKDVKVDRIEPDSCLKSQKLTKTVIKQTIFASSTEVNEYIRETFMLAKNKIELKNMITNSLMLNIPKIANPTNIRISKSPKFTCNFLRTDQFYRIEFIPDLVFFSQTSNRFFKSSPTFPDDIKNKNFDLACHYFDLKPSKLLESSGYQLARVKSLKKNRYVEYIGHIPKHAHPHFIIVQSPHYCRNAYGVDYSPISHAIRVGFSSLTSSLLVKSRSEGCGTGWGYIYGTDLPQPLCTYILVVCNTHLLFVKYQLNTLQLYNDDGICNEAEISSNLLYHESDGSLNQNTLSSLKLYINEVFH